MLALEIANWVILIVGVPLIVLTTWLFLRSFEQDADLLRLGPRLHFWKFFTTRRAN